MPALTLEPPSAPAPEHGQGSRPKIEPDDLRSRSVRGVVWTFAGQSVVFGSQFAMLAVLARLLSAPEMGVVALTFTAINLALVFGGCGFGRGLVQQSNPRRVDHDSAFWGSVIAGTAAWVLCAAVATPVARLIGAETLGPILLAIGAMLLLAALWQVPAAILERQLRFREIETAQLLGYALPMALVTILAAAMGAGAWSLVAGALAGGTLQTGLLFRASGWRPGGRPRWSAARRLLGFGAGITGSSGVAFVLANVDYVIVGQVLGPAQLGLYSIAYQLAAIPRSRIAQAVLRVAFPAFSRIQDRHDRLNRAYIRLTELVAYVVFPLLAGLFVLSEPAISVLFGERWAAAAPALRILCPAGALMAVRATVGSVLAAVGRPGPGLYANLAVLAVSVPLLFLAAPHGIESVAWVILGVAALNLLPLQFVMRRLTGLSVTGFLAALIPPAVMAGAAAAVAALVAGAFEAPWARLAVGTAAGATVYAGLVLLCARNLVRNTAKLLREESCSEPHPSEPHPG